MRLVAGRDLQGGRVDLDEVARLEPVADARATMRLRASRHGRRSAWTSGAHQGEACGHGGRLVRLAARRLRALAVGVAAAGARRRASASGGRPRSGSAASARPPGRVSRQHRFKENRP